MEDTPKQTETTGEFILEKEQLEKLRTASVWLSGLRVPPSPKAKNSGENLQPHRLRREENRGQEQKSKRKLSRDLQKG